MLGTALRNLGGFGGIGRSIWSSNVGRQAVYGGLGGGLYGAFSDRSSILGGAIQGAGVGAMVGGAKGFGMKASIAAGALFADNSLVGGAVGAGLFAGGRYGVKLGQRGLGLYNLARRGGRTPRQAMGIAGKRMWRAAITDGRASARHIGRTAKKGYNSFRSIFAG